LAASEVQGIYNAGNAGKCAVSSAPAILSQPVSRNVFVGATVTFSVTASGYPSPTYQWRKNQADISNATNSTFSISNVQTNDSGSYSVVVSNLLGGVTSSNAVLLVSQLSSN